MVRQKWIALVGVVFLLAVGVAADAPTAEDRGALIASLYNNAVEKADSWEVVSPRPLDLAEEGVADVDSDADSMDIGEQNLYDAWKNADQQLWGQFDKNMDNQLLETVRQSGNVEDKSVQPLANAVKTFEGALGLDAKTIDSAPNPVSGQIEQLQHDMTQGKWDPAAVESSSAVAANSKEEESSVTLKELTLQARGGDDASPSGDDPAASHGGSDVAADTHSGDKAVTATSPSDTPAASSDTTADNNADTYLSETKDSSGLDGDIDNLQASVQKAAKSIDDIGVSKDAPDTSMNDPLMAGVDEMAPDVTSAVDGDADLAEKGATKGPEQGAKAVAAASPELNEVANKVKGINAPIHFSMEDVANSNMHVSGPLDKGAPTGSAGGSGPVVIKEKDFDVQTKDVTDLMDSLSKPVPDVDVTQVFESAKGPATDGLLEKINEDEKDAMSEAKTEYEMAKEKAGKKGAAKEDDAMDDEDDLHDMKSDAKEIEHAGANQAAADADKDGGDSAAAGGASISMAVQDSLSGMSSEGSADASSLSSADASSDFATDADQTSSEDISRGQSSGDDADAESSGSNLPAAIPDLDLDEEPTTTASKPAAAAAVPSAPSKDGDEASPEPTPATQVSADGSASPEKAAAPAPDAASVTAQPQSDTSAPPSSAAAGDNPDSDTVSGGSSLADSPSSDDMISKVASDVNKQITTMEAKEAGAEPAAPAAVPAAAPASPSKEALAEDSTSTPVTSATTGESPTSDAAAAKPAVADPKDGVEDDQAAAVAAALGPSADLSNSNTQAVETAATTAGGQGQKVEKLGNWDDDKVNDMFAGNKDAQKTVADVAKGVSDLGETNPSTPSATSASSTAGSPLADAPAVVKSKSKMPDLKEDAEEAAKEEQAVDAAALPGGGPPQTAANTAPAKSPDSDHQVHITDPGIDDGIPGDAPKAAGTSQSKTDIMTSVANDDGINDMTHDDAGDDSFGVPGAKEAAAAAPVHKNVDKDMKAYDEALALMKKEKAKNGGKLPKVDMDSPVVDSSSHEQASAVDRKLEDAGLLPKENVSDLDEFHFPDDLKASDAKISLSTSQRISAEASNVANKLDADTDYEIVSDKDLKNLTPPSQQLEKDVSEASANAETVEKNPVGDSGADGDKESDADSSASVDTTPGDKADADIDNEVNTLTSARDDGTPVDAKTASADLGEVANANATSADSAPTAAKSATRESSADDDNASDNKHASATSSLPSPAAEAVARNNTSSAASKAVTDMHEKASTNSDDDDSDDSDDIDSGVDDVNEKDVTTDAQAAAAVGPTDGGVMDPIATVTDDAGAQADLKASNMLADSATGHDVEGSEEYQEAADDDSGAESNEDEAADEAHAASERLHKKHHRHHKTHHKAKNGDETNDDNHTAKAAHHEAKSSQGHKGSHHEKSSHHYKQKHEESNGDGKSKHHAKSEHHVEKHHPAKHHEKSEHHEHIGQYHEHSKKTETYHRRHASKSLRGSGKKNHQNHHGHYEHNLSEHSEDNSVADLEVGGLGLDADFAEHTEPVKPQTAAPKKAKKGPPLTGIDAIKAAVSSDPEVSAMLKDPDASALSMNMTATIDDFKIDPSPVIDKLKRHGKGHVEDENSSTQHHDKDAQKKHVSKATNKHSSNMHKKHHKKAHHQATADSDGDDLDNADTQSLLSKLKASGEAGDLVDEIQSTLDEGDELASDAGVDAPPSSTEKGGANEMGDLGSIAVPAAAAATGEAKDKTGLMLPTPDFGDIGGLSIDASSTSK